MTDLARRALLSGMAGSTLLVAGAGRAAADDGDPVQNILSAAVAWRETDTPAYRARMLQAAQNLVP